MGLLPPAAVRVSLERPQVADQCLGYELTGGHVQQARVHLQLDRHADALVDATTADRNMRWRLQRLLPDLLGVTVLHKLQDQQYRVHLVHDAASELEVGAAEPRRAHVRVSPL